MNRGNDDLQQVYFYSLFDPSAPHYDKGELCTPE